MSRFWTNRSVLALGAEDPETEILERAQRMVLEAVELGWAGPPFDPFELARLRGLEIMPREDLYDARVLSAGSRLRIEYNPARPRARQRYSIAHEIAHTLFQMSRRRLATGRVR
jgi:IrrE N-terminal-like domain